MSHRVLLIEDDASHRRTLERHLSRSGYELLAVETGEEGLAGMARFDPHLVLTDVHLPGLDGFRVMERIRESRSDVEVIMITAFDQVQTAIDAMKGGAYDYLVKPLDLDELDRVVGQCLQDRAVKERKEQEPATEPLPKGAIVGNDRKMREIYKLIGTLSRSRAPVLIRGETGTGKELIARTIHENSTAAGRPFVPVNCAAVPETLLESELFGHLKGSYTGATTERRGRFEVAGDGTLFLDEVGDTSLSFQAKLLRVLQEGEFYPLGSEGPRVAHCRIMAATNVDLEQKVEEGTFRDDLLFRLRVIEIVAPPLRERRGDIPALVDHVLRRVSSELGCAVPTIPDDVMAFLVSHEWPGNVRELENAVTRAAVLARGGVLAAEDLGIEQSPVSFDPPGGGLELDAVERYHVQTVLNRTSGNKTQAASMLGISRPRLNRMIDRLGIPA